MSTFFFTFFKTLNQKHRLSIKTIKNYLVLFKIEKADYPF